MSQSQEVEVGEYSFEDEVQQARVVLMPHRLWWESMQVTIPNSRENLSGCFRRMREKSEGERFGGELDELEATATADWTPDLVEAMDATLSGMICDSS